MSSLPSLLDFKDQRGFQGMEFSLPLVDVIADETEHRARQEEPRHVGRNRTVDCQGDCRLGESSALRSSFKKPRDLSDL